MKVRMLVDMSGTRDGQPWPARGNIVDLPDDEAAGYCRQMIATPVTDYRSAENTDLPTVEERVLTTRTGPTKRPITKEE